MKEVKKRVSLKAVYNTLQEMQEAMNTLLVKEKKEDKPKFKIWVAYRTETGLPEKDRFFSSNKKLAVPGGALSLLSGFIKSIDKARVIIIYNNLTGHEIYRINMK